MPATDIDDLRFTANPDRAYRLHRQTSVELQGLPVLPREGLTGWSVIRDDDGAMKRVAVIEANPGTTAISS